MRRARQRPQLPSSVVRMEAERPIAILEVVGPRGAAAAVAGPRGAGPAIRAAADVVAAGAAPVAHTAVILAHAVGVEHRAAPGRAILAAVAAHGAVRGHGLDVDLVRLGAVAADVPLLRAGRHGGGRAAAHRQEGAAHALDAVVPRGLQREHPPRVERLGARAAVEVRVGGARVRPAAAGFAAFVLRAARDAAAAVAKRLAAQPDGAVLVVRELQVLVARDEECLARAGELVRAARHLEVQPPERVRVAARDGDVRARDVRAEPVVERVRANPDVLVDHERAHAVAPAGHRLAAGIARRACLPHVNRDALPAAVEAHIGIT